MRILRPIRLTQGKQAQDKFVLMKANKRMRAEILPEDLFVGFGNFIIFSNYGKI